MYHYTNSSQVALIGDRVELPGGIRADLRGLWVQRGKVMAEVVYPGPAGTACMEMVPLESLVYIPPEQEAAEVIWTDAQEAAQAAQAVLTWDSTGMATVVDQAVAARLGTEEGWAYQVRLDALQAAVRFAMRLDDEPTPDDVLKVAEIFSAYLSPSGEAPADGPVDG